MSAPPDLPLVARARRHADRAAVAAAEGAFTYAELLDASARVAAALLDGAADLGEARVAFLAPPGWHYVAAQWGAWRAGGIAVPLAVSHPPAELQYVIRDADAAVVVAHPDFADVLRPIAGREGRRFLLTADALAAAPGPLPPVAEGRRAAMVYTSGTTGKPKGVVTTHANLRAQVESLVEAWEWSADDRTLLVLPLHHVHGIVNVLTCALWSGAVCEMLPVFDADEAWRRIESGRLTLFMAVPTVYRRLVAAWEAAPPGRRARMSEGCRRMRLMVSGSAALPAQTLERWREISGHVLLERYGMTEIGMALSNPLHGERRPGYVGLPLPGVEVRLVDEAGREVPPGTPGEVEVRGPTVFLEYWRRPDATAAAFREGGWFRTGDVGVVEDGYYRLLGRSSVDIIKTGGYKVSALEIEEVLRAHPAVAECAVVGVEDADWGERVSAAVELKDGAALTLDELQAWARERLAPYKLPRALRAVAALPRNAMGKVTKPDVAKLFRGS
ncbi:MAG TPA: acyl-CoA synthetase [Longimicrobium sp.]|jgi:malonyl-CoA/methylmalonyl-CoA synthetase